MNPDFSQNGTWIYIDPDEQSIEQIEETLDLDTLCDLLRCEATDMEELGGPFVAYIDGEGASQERQTEWSGYLHISGWGQVWRGIIVRNRIR